MKFFHTPCLVLLLFALHITAFAQQQSPATADPGISLALVVPSGADGQRTLSLVRNPRFHVLATNTSPQPINLWKDWTSWGMKTLTLILQTPAKTTGIIRLPMRGIDGDFPDFWILMPGETLVLEVNMADISWRGFPDLYGETVKGTLTAVYEIKPDYLTDEFGIWTGKVYSQALEVVLKN